jgi:hypothetical protein
MAASDPIERLRKICLALPQATEKIAWGEPTFRVGGKLFAQVDNHHHGAEHVAVWLPMPLGAQEGLVYADPRRFFVPPYVGKRGWIGVRIDLRPSWQKVAELVREAYLFVAPKRLAAALAAGTVGTRMERARAPIGMRTARPTPSATSRGRAPARTTRGRRRQ